MNTVQATPTYKRDRPTLNLLEYRPRFHLQPPAGWANDLSALYWKKRWHVFYGYMPTYPLSMPKIWGHASTRDFIRWRHYPPMLPVTPGGYDKDGSWTGCVVINGDTPTAFYTGVHPQVQCMATSRDMITWQKYPGNPIIANPPSRNVRTFRDPCVWREADAWYMAIGSGFKNRSSAVLLYRSRDMIHWDYIHPLFEGPLYGPRGGPKNIDMYECPDFFPLGDNYVLLVSTQHEGRGRTLYFVGRYENHRFYPEQEGWTDYGCDYYAAKTAVDGQGRRILLGGSPDCWTDDLTKAAGWAGAYTFPRELRLLNDGRLGIAPARELRKLRGRGRRFEARSIKSDHPWTIPGIRSWEIELRLELAPGRASKCGVILYCTPAKDMIADREKTFLYYDRSRRALVFDRRLSSFYARFWLPQNTDIQTAPLALARGESLKLHVFIDHSLLEVYFNGGRCLTARVYPLRPISHEVCVFAEGGAARLEALDIWPMTGAAVSAVEADFHKKGH